MNIPIESLNFQMLNVGLAKHDADWNWQNVVSPFTRIYLVTEGYAKLYLPNRVVDLLSGHMYIVPAHTVHSYECAGKFSHYYLHFYEGFKKETDIFDFYDFPVEIDSNALDEASLIICVSIILKLNYLPVTLPRMIIWANSLIMSIVIMSYHWLRKWS